MELESVVKLGRDLKSLKIADMTVTEIRFLVDSYYTIQEYRKATDNQVLAMSKSGEPHEVIAWFSAQSSTIEAQIKRVLDKWTDSHAVSRWAKSITGIGPVISAGLAAHIDITKAPTAGHIWRFAGLDPTQVWDKGQKRPWNASLKTLCWKIGESFVKVSGMESDVYGKVYLARKEAESSANEQGNYAVQAAAKLEKFKIGKGTVARASYDAGRLPAAHIHARAKRYAVKLFLSHWHQVAYEIHYGCPAPKPWVLEHGGHVHYNAPPNWPRMTVAGD